MHKLSLIPDKKVPEKHSKKEDGFFKKIGNLFRRKDHLEKVNEKLAELNQNSDAEILPVEFVAIRSYGKGVEESKRGFDTGLKFMTEAELDRAMGIALKLKEEKSGYLV